MALARLGMVALRAKGMGELVVRTVATGASRRARRPEHRGVLAMKRGRDFSERNRGERNSMSSGGGGYGRRGGGGRGRRGGGGGRGGRGGGGEKRWWDAEWREAKLASIRGSQTQLDEAAVKQQMLELRASQKTEAVLGEGYSREDQSRIIQLAASLRLHCKAYGSGARRTLVASKEELPNYRPEFDRRTPQHTIGIDPRAQDAVRRAIQQMDALAPPPPLPVRRAGVPGPRSGAADDNSDVGPRRPGAMIGPQRPAASPIGPHRPPASSPGPARAAAAADGVAALWSDADASGEGSDTDDLNEDLRTATSPGQLPGSSGARADAEVNLRLQEQQRRQQESEAVRKMLEFRRKLPAFNMRQQLLRAVAGGQVLVVSGETGCGKTTQLPQFILEEAIEAGRGSECSIVCTQPRRISAISVAERVAAERGEKLGEAVGYQIRLEAEMSASTRLLFCTTGILLRRLVADPKLTGVSHVVVDEIHERGMYEDFLLIILRDMLPARPDLKLILMSATLNADRFAAYFGGCPTAHIPGFTHPVEDLFLEHILQHSNIRIASPEPASGGGSKGRRGGRQRPAAAGGPQQGKPPYMLEAERYRDLTPAVQASMRHWAEAALEGGSNNGKLDLDLVGNVVSWICTELPEGAVLVFLTGWDDIKKLHEMLENRPVTGDRSRVRLLPLHGSMPTVNQRVIFDRPPPGVRKVVLATNIAETSITIDDIVYVVDTGKSKQKTYDPLNQLARLLPDWTSKASVKQRRGRAGRLQPGLCLHLFPQHMHDSWMDQYQLPELQRTPLEGLCLQIKSLQLGGVESFLNKAMDPPDSRSVVNALRLLTDIGALDSEERLTALGHHLAALPVDPLIGKMIVFGAVFDVLDPILTIAAGISYRDPFVLPMDKKEEADTARQRLAGDTRSDHFAILNAFEGFLQQKATGGHRAARDYCFRNFLSMNTLEMMSDMRKQFAELLQGIGFLRAKGLSENASLQQLLAAHSHQCDNSDLIRAVMCSGMFPNVVSVHQKKRRATLLTATDGTVKAHPSSVNAVERFFPHRWLVYSAKVQTSDVFVQASTMVSDYALLLFGGQVRESADAPGQVTMLNGFITFTAEPQVVHTILDLKSRLQGLLQHKIRNPALDITDAGSPLIHALLALLQSEPEANQMHRSLYSRRGERDDDNDNYRSFSRARDDNGW